MIILAATMLVALAGPDGQTIWVNPFAVLTVREPREGTEEHFAPGTRCVLNMSDGKLVLVATECPEVLAKVRGGVWQ